MQRFTVTIEPCGKQFEVRAGKPILAEARRAGISMPHECGWGSCGTCKVKLLQGEVDFLFAGAPALSERDRRFNRILVCQSTATSDLVLQGEVLPCPREDLNSVDYQGILIKVEELHPFIWSFRFKLEQPAHFLPGQYAILDCGEGVRRVYSMSNLPGTPEVEFIVRRSLNGPGTQWLFQLQPGAIVNMEMPFGTAYLRDSAGNLAFIAGGTGIAPILGMLRAVATTKEFINRQIWVFYGARSPEELVCLSEIKALASTFSNLNIVLAVEKATLEWDGEVGYITDAVARHLKDQGSYEIYMGGPPIMVQATLALLSKLGISLSRIHYDSFG